MVEAPASAFVFEAVGPVFFGLVPRLYFVSGPFTVRRAGMASPTPYFNPAIQIPGLVGGDSLRFER